MTRTVNFLNKHGLFDSQYLLVQLPLSRVQSHFHHHLCFVFLLLEAHECDSSRQFHIFLASVALNILRSKLDQIKGLEHIDFGEIDVELSR